MSVKGSGDWIFGTYYGYEGWSMKAYKTKQEAIEALKRNPSNTCEIFKKVDIEIKEDE